MLCQCEFKFNFNLNFKFDLPVRFKLGPGPGPARSSGFKTNFKFTASGDSDLKFARARPAGGARATFSSYSSGSASYYCSSLPIMMTRRHYYQSESPL